MSQSDINPTNYCYTTILAPRSSRFSADFPIPACFSERKIAFTKEISSLEKNEFKIVFECRNFTIQFSLTFLSERLFLRSMAGFVRNGILDFKRKKKERALMSFLVVLSRVLQDKSGERPIDFSA